MDPVGQDVNSTGQGEPVDRSGPVGPQSTTNIKYDVNRHRAARSALLGLMTDGTENAPVYPGGPDMNSAGRGTGGPVRPGGLTAGLARVQVIPSSRSCSVSIQTRRETPPMTRWAMT